MKGAEISALKIFYSIPIIMFLELIRKIETWDRLNNENASCKFFFNILILLNEIDKDSHEITRILKMECKTFQPMKMNRC